MGIFHLESSYLTYSCRISVYYYFRALVLHITPSLTEIDGQEFLETLKGGFSRTRGFLRVVVRF